MQDSTARKVVWGAILIYFLFFGLLVLLKSRIDQHPDDTTLYTQALWSTLAGRPYGTTWLGETGPGGSFLGLHFELTLILLCPLYALWPGPDSLLLLQVLLVALTAYPVYTCGVYLLRNPLCGLCFAIAHLASPFVQRALFYDFHHECLLYFAMVWAGSLLIQERYRLFLAAALLAALTREDALLHVFALGLVALLFRRRIALGIGTMAVSVAGFLVITSVLIPHFRAEPNPIFANRYPELGNDMPSIVRTVIFNPGTLLSIMRDPDNLQSLVHAILPLGFLPILSLPAILLMAPAIAEMYLTPVPSLKHLGLFYPFVVMPLFTIAAMWTLGRWPGKLRGSDRVRHVASFIVLALSLYAMLFYDGHYTFGKDRYHSYYLKQFPLARGFSWQYFLANDHERIVRRFITENIPPEVPLATEIRFAADLSDRFVLEPLTAVKDADLIFFDLYGRPYVEAVGSFVELLHRPDFGMVAFEDGYTLLRRGADPAANKRLIQLMAHRLEAEDLDGDTGADIADHQCTNRIGRRAQASRDVPGLLITGRSPLLAPGPHAAVFRLKISKPGSGRRHGNGGGSENSARIAGIAELAVLEPETLNLLARRSISASDFSRPGEYEELSLPFNVVAPAAPPSPAADSGPLRVELRIVYHATADLSIDRIEISGVP